MKLYYQMPEKEKVVQLVDNIPNHWHWAKGDLYADGLLHESKRIAEETRLEIYMNKRGFIDGKIVASEDRPFEGYTLNPAVFGMIYKGDANLLGILSSKFPSSLKIEWQDQEARMGYIKPILSLLIGQGYKGEISIAKRVDSAPRYNPVEKIYIDHFNKQIVLDWSHMASCGIEEMEAIMDQIGILKKE